MDKSFFSCIKSFIFSYLTLLRDRASPEAFRFLHDTLERHLMDVHGNAAMLGHLVDQIETVTLDVNDSVTTNLPFLSTTSKHVQTTGYNVTSTTESYHNLEGFYTLREGMDYLPRTLIAQFVGAGIE